MMKILFYYLIVILLSGCKSSTRSDLSVKKLGTRNLQQLVYKNDILEGLINGKNTEIETGEQKNEGIYNRIFSIKDNDQEILRIPKSNSINPVFLGNLEKSYSYIKKYCNSDDSKIDFCEHFLIPKFQGVFTNKNRNNSKIFIQIFQTLDSKDNLKSLASNYHFVNKNGDFDLAKMTQTVDFIKNLIRQLFPVLKFIRETDNVNHFDIKPDNLFFANNLFVLTDLDSLLNCQADDNFNVITAYSGQLNHQNACYTDLFGLGVTILDILFEGFYSFLGVLVSGRLWNPNKDNVSIFIEKKIKNLKEFYESIIDTDLEDLISHSASLLSGSTQKRLEAEEKLIELASGT